MPLQITTDITTLSKRQRESLAAFILMFGLGTDAEPLDEVGVVPDEEHRDITAVQAYEAFGVPAPDALHTIPPPPPIVTAEVPPPPPAEIRVSNVGPSLVIGAPTTDKSGVIWDANIHSSSKALTADGNWRKKRGGPAEIAAIPTPAGTITTPATVSVPPPPPPAASTEPDLRGAFVSLIGSTSAAIQAGKLTQDEVTTTCVAAGIASLPLLATRLDLVAGVAASIDAIIASRA